MGQVLAWDSLIPEIRALRSVKGSSVVFTNGCFDLLHPGHIDLLERCRALGDLLVVAINSDAGVRQLKGPSRPLVPQSERAELLAGLACVDYVTFFDEPTPRELIARLLPNVLVKGGDWPLDLSKLRAARHSAPFSVRLPLRAHMCAPADSSIRPACCTPCYSPAPRGVPCYW